MYGITLRAGIIGSIDALDSKREQHQDAAGNNVPNHNRCTIRIEKRYQAIFLFLFSSYHRDSYLLQKQQKSKRTTDDGQWNSHCPASRTRLDIF
jgi:hypothetical protein